MTSSNKLLNNNRRGLSEEGFELYKMYCALKAHFTTSKYDYFKSGGAINVKRSSYVARPDAGFFTAIAKSSKDRFGLLLANILRDPKTWIGEIDAETVDNVYNDWKRRTDQFEYYFESDLNSLKDEFSFNFNIDKEGNTPYILDMAMEGSINFETFAVLTNILSLNTIWDGKLQDEFIAPKAIDRAVKYHPFIYYNRNRAKEIIRSRWCAV